MPESREANTGIGAANVALSSTDAAGPSSISRATAAGSNALRRSGRGHWIAGLVAVTGALTMGLFTWGKKKVEPPATPAEVRVASSGTPIASVGLAASASDAMDELMVKARSGEPGSMARLWAAIYQVPKWHFVRRNGADPFSTSFNAFWGVVDGEPSVFAFTDANRASKFGVRQRLGEPDGFAVIEMPVDAAVATILKLQSSGVTRLIVNDESPSGCFAPLTNLVPMYSHYLGVPLAEAAARLGADVAAALHDRASQTGRSEHIGELIAWSMSQPEWWLLAGPAGEVFTWTTAEGDVTAAVFTSQDRMEKAGRMMKLAPDAEPLPSLRMRPIDAITRLDELAVSRGLMTVALNLRLPLRAGTLKQLHESMSDGRPSGGR